MNTKKKLVVTFTIIALVFVATIVAFLAVFASMQQSIRTSLNINYSAKDIQGTVQATYSYGNKSGYLKTSSGDTVLRFNAEDDNQNGTLSFPADETIELTAKNNYLLLTYMFTNSGDALYTAFMNIDPSTYSSKNMTIEYGMNPQDFTTNQFALVVRETQPGETVKFYIKVKINDVNSSDL